MTDRIRALVESSEWLAPPWPEIHPRTGGADVLVERSRGRAYPGPAPLHGRRVEGAGLDSIPLHGLRHTFATRAGALGFSDTMVGELLGHRKKTVTSAYQHLEKETRDEAEKVQADLWTALNRPVGGEVVPIERTKA